MKWYENAVMYHIYPLGFCGAPKHNEGGEPVNRLEKVLDWIPHLKELGVDAVYFGPVFESVEHGYDTTDYRVIDRRLGTNEMFAHICDELHKNGIRVILDGVFNHVGRNFWAFKDVQEKGQASEYCDWFAGLNFGGQSPCGDNFWYEGWNGYYNLVKLNLRNWHVCDYLIDAVKLWMDEFHIDGIRVDAVSSMLYLNYARRDGEWTPNRDGGNINLGAVAFLQKLNTTLLTAWPGCMTIAEESSAYPGVTKPPYDGGLGFSFKWDMGFMHDTLDYLELDPYFRKYHHDKLTFSMMYAFSENFILAFSHDEVVHGKKSMLDKMFGTYEQKFATLRTLYGYQFAHPGKKLTFMGSEFGQFIEWNYKQGLDWLLLDYPMHKAMQRWCSALNACYHGSRALWDIDDGWDGFTWLNVDDAERSAIAFLRTARNGRRVVCVCNFTPVRYDDFVIGLPKRGVLRELLSSDAEDFGGTGIRNAPEIRSEDTPFGALPCSARVTLPPLTTIAPASKTDNSFFCFISLFLLFE